MFLKIKYDMHKKKYLQLLNNPWYDITYGTCTIMAINIGTNFNTIYEIIYLVMYRYMQQVI